MSIRKIVLNNMQHLSIFNSSEHRTAILFWFSYCVKPEALPRYQPSTIETLSCFCFVCMPLSSGHPLYGWYLTFLEERHRKVRSRSSYTIVSACLPVYRFRYIGFQQIDCPFAPVIPGLPKKEKLVKIRQKKCNNLHFEIFFGMKKLYRNPFCYSNRVKNETACR